MPVKKTLDISSKQLKELKERIAMRELVDSDYELLQGLTETVECLSQALAEKEASIGRLCKYLLGAPTETAKNVLKKQNTDGDQEADSKDNQEQGSCKKKKHKGHGRNPAADYTGADRVHIEHPDLKSGDTCPICINGKVYELALPSVFVHITGNAPLKATTYERSRLRCNACGEIFTPELPQEVGKQKYTASAAAMLALLKYGCGMPLYRLDKLQRSLGQPVPASTQWDILNTEALKLAPVFDALLHCAAQGDVIHNDDTTMRILNFLPDQDADNTRTGIYTTGLVSQYLDYQIALFMTGNNHAGENLTAVLRRRATGLSPPIQMCDALSRNSSKEFETIMVNCMAHARRNFVELVDHFPQKCALIIEHLGTVYHHDAICQEKNLSNEQRLAYHQEYSAPIMEKIKTWCSQQMDNKLVEPNSGLGKAINYLQNHWEKLTRFLTVPGAPLDNNICERALKHAILHRKNALFYKTQRGARVGDMFMSLIHTCQLQGINPLDYLTWLLQNVKELAKTPQAYLPWCFRSA